MHKTMTTMIASMATAILLTVSTSACNNLQIHFQSSLNSN